MVWASAARSPVARRHADQLAEPERREDVGEVGHELHVTRSGQVGHEPVGLRGQEGLHVPNPARREGPVHERPPATVVLALVVERR